MTRREEYQAILNELNIEPVRLSQTTERCLDRARIKRRALWWKIPFTAAALSACLFVTLLNTSLAFARVIGEMPLLGDLAEFVTFDPGLKAAVENKYVQPVGISRTDNGIRLNVSYIIADQQRLIIFYTVEREDKAIKSEKDRFLSLNGVTDRNGQKLDLPIATQSSSISETGLQSFTCDLNKSILPESFVLQLSIIGSSGSSNGADGGSATAERKELASYSIPIHIEKIQEAKVYTPKVKVVNQGQTFTVDQIEVFPTTTKVTLTFDSQNTALLHGIDMELKDDKGHIWNVGGTGISGSYDGSGGCGLGNLDKIYLESSYFSGAKHLSLVIKSMSWLPVNEQIIKVDTVDGTAGPLPAELRLIDLKREDEGLFMAFEVKNKENEYGTELIYSVYRDGEGGPYYIEGSGTTGQDLPDGSGKVIVQSFYVDHFAGGTVYLERTWTPKTILEEPIEVKLK